MVVIKLNLPVGHVRCRLPVYSFWWHVGGQVTGPEANSKRHSCVFSQWGPGVHLHSFPAFPPRAGYNKKSKGKAVPGLVNSGAQFTCFLSVHPALSVMAFIFMLVLSCQQMEEEVRDLLDEHWPQPTEKTGSMNVGGTNPITNPLPLGKSKEGDKDKDVRRFTSTSTHGERSWKSRL